MGGGGGCLLPSPAVSESYLSPPLYPSYVSLQQVIVFTRGCCARLDSTGPPNVYLLQNEVTNCDPGNRNNTRLKRTGAVNCCNMHHLSLHGEQRRLSLAYDALYLVLFTCLCAWVFFLLQRC